MNEHMNWCIRIGNPDDVQEPYPQAQGENTG